MTKRIKVEPPSSSNGELYGKPLEHDPHFKGALEKRSCTDIICLLLFLAFLIGWAVVGGFAAFNGNPSRLLSPTDSIGQVCGQDELVKDKPYLFFFDITRCASPKVPFTGCPTAQVCVSKCPTKNWFYLSTVADKSELICKYEVDVNDSKSIKDLIRDGDCASYYVHSGIIAGRCIPEINASSSLLDLGGKPMKTENDKPLTISTLVMSLKQLGSFLKAQEVVEGVVEDVRNLWPMILLGCAIAMIISLIWICLLRFIASIMVWFSLIAFTLLSGFASYYTLNKYLKIRDQMESKNMSPTEMAFTSEFSKVAELETTWLVLFIITVVVFLICLILVIFLRTRIRLAVALICEASKAVGHTMTSLVFPLIPYVLHLFFILVFCVVFLLLASSGLPQYRVVCHGDCSNCSPLQENSTCNPETFLAPNCTNQEARCQFFSYEKGSATGWFHAYNLFGLFWSMFFVTSFGEMVLSGAFSLWYWSFKKPHDVPSFPLMRSMKRTLRYHMGTLAFGSLVIAIVRMIRVIFEYVHHKVKKHADYAIIKVLACMCRCCLWCLEKFLRFINRNAYIYCAIYGKNFCNSARKSFYLIMRNVARVVILDKVTEFLLLIGKLVVTGIMALLSFFFFSGEIVQLRDHLPEVNYYMTPVIIISVASFFIASSFFSVYTMAVDTLFLCFLEDCERNDGSPERPYFMSKNLMQILSKSNKQKGE